MTPSKDQARFERFAGNFLLSVLVGGDVSIGRPLTPGMLGTFVHARPVDTDTETRIASALRQGAAHIAPLSHIAWPLGGVIPLAMAAHNLLSITDPQFLRWEADEHAEPFSTGSIGSCSKPGLQKPVTMCSSGTRFPGRFFEVNRTDVTAQNWAFTHRYVGRTMPTGWLTKPRWVELRHRERRFSEIIEALDRSLHAPLRVSMLLARTPLTQLLVCDRNSFEFSAPVLTALSDARLRSGAAHALVAKGRATMAPLGAALRRLTEIGLPSPPGRPGGSVDRRNAPHRCPGCAAALRSRVVEPGER